MSEDEDEDDSWTFDELDEVFSELDEDLDEAIRRPNDRQLLRELAELGVWWLAELKLPLGLGNLLDQLLIRPKAAAIVLRQKIAIANKNVPALPDDAGAVLETMGELRRRIVPVAEFLAARHSVPFGDDE